jgi:hypothetical protein
MEIPKERGEDTAATNGTTAAQHSPYILTMVSPRTTSVEPCSAPSDSSTAAGQDSRKGPWWYAPEPRP